VDYANIGNFHLGELRGIWSQVASFWYRYWHVERTQVLYQKVRPTGKTFVLLWVNWREKTHWL